MIFAVVPAAGHSQRMGRPKLALPLAGRSVLEHVVTALRAGGCDSVVVVVGPHVPELVPLAEAASGLVVSLPQPTIDMRSTVQKGLDWLGERFHPSPDDPWLLSPGDHPTLDADVVRQLHAAYTYGRKSIVVPTFDGKRGHPTLFAWRHVESIRAFPSDQGLNAYLKSQPNETLEVAVAARVILDDLDTQEDYKRLQASLE
jgi:molybdenum cofactor cytidylyltransferase